MNIAETGLKGFVEHVSEMVLKLLGSLHCEEVITATGETAQLLWFIAIITVA